MSAPPTSELPQALATLPRTKLKVSTVIRRLYFCLDKSGSIGSDIGIVARALNDTLTFLATQNLGIYQLEVSGCWYDDQSIPLWPNGWLSPKDALDKGFVTPTAGGSTAGKLATTAGIDQMFAALGDPNARQGQPHMVIVTDGHFTDCTLDEVKAIAWKGVRRHVVPVGAVNDDFVKALAGERGSIHPAANINDLAAKLLAATTVAAQEPAAIVQTPAAAT